MPHLPAAECSDLLAKLEATCSLWTFPFDTLFTICSVNGAFDSVGSKVLVGVRKLFRRSNRRRFLCRGDLPVSLISRFVSSAIELSRWCCPTRLIPALRDFLESSDDLEEGVALVCIYIDAIEACPGL
jgi:hypothetical protein